MVYGEAYVYQVDDAGMPGDPVVFESAQPVPGDLFGHAVSVSQRAAWLAISSPNREPPADDTGMLRGAVDIFRRTDMSENHWELDGTVFVPATFGRGMFRLRVDISDRGLLAVGSSDEDKRGATLLFRRLDNGTWQQEADLRPPEDDTESKFGIYTVFADSADEITISAPYFAREPNTKYGRLAPYRFDAANAKWQARASRLDPAPSELAMFSWAMQSYADRLMVGAPGATVDGEVGGGRIYEFRYDPNAPSGWNPVGNVTSPVVSAKTAFGKRVAFYGDLMAASSLVGGLNDGNFTLISVFAQPTGGAWTPVASISGEQDGSVWLGRIAIGENFLALAAPNETIDGAEDAGAVFIFPKRLFQSAILGND